MKILGNAIDSQLILVYGLIALVIVLIIVIIWIDRKESKQKPKNLFNTLNMKIITDIGEDNTSAISEDNHSDSILENEETIKENPNVTGSQNLDSIPEVETISTGVTENIPFSAIEKKVEVKGIHPGIDLEKTQAQIRVEEITDALRKAQLDEKIEEDKYSSFEEEQEKNAIISYQELKDSFDKLYSENEKMQYLEDDEIPINIKELYQLKQDKEFLADNQEKIQMKDLSNFTSSSKEKPPISTFKSSPVISPVYGIQKEESPTKNTVDMEIQNANQFLQSLKELKNNLD